MAKPTRRCARNDSKIVQSEFRYSGAMSDRLFPDEAERPLERRAG